MKLLTTAKFCFYCDGHRADLVFFVAFVYLFRVTGGWSRPNLGCNIPEQAQGRLKQPCQTFVGALFLLLSCTCTLTLRIH